ncbi:hypothetical protein CerSpe_242260 [Prunus speciosa]
MCSYCNPRHISDVYGTPCPNKNNSMSTRVTYVSPQASSSTVVATSGSEGGYVKGVVTYMVMDNLEVKPLSTISSIAALNQFNVKDVGALREVVVHLGKKEGLKLLKASFETSAVLTKVFLGFEAAKGIVRDQCSPYQSVPG